MDIVASTLEKLHCLLEIDSVPGRGTRFRMTLPLYSIIEHVMVFRTEGKLFGVPMTFVKTAAEGESQFSRSSDASAARPLEAVDLLKLGSRTRADEGKKLVLGLQRRQTQAASSASSRQGSFKEQEDLTLVVDEIVGPEEIVVRPLPDLVKHHPFLSGVTVSGRGEILQLLDCYRLIQQARQLTREPVSEPPALASPENRPWSVLVTDDSISARRRLVQKLKPYNVKITEATDGLVALEKLREQSFDILFTDLEMEQMNGFDLLAEIPHASIERPRHMVMITSRTEPAVRKRARELGALACLAKPISDEDLQAILQEMQVCEGTPN
jgi:CheY-like chemotaxis protein